MIFNSPWFLILLPLLPMFYWFRKRYSKRVTIRFSSVRGLKKLEDSWVSWIVRLQKIMVATAFVFLIIALARPQLVLDEVSSETEGIDIVMVLDVSRSMAAKDFKPSRFDVLKSASVEFIKARIHDRIGVVVFGTDAYTLFPLTTDHESLLPFVQKMRLSSAGSGTAIGMAVATGVRRLVDSDSKSKVLVLVTDGVNNSGEVSPKKAAELAASKGIKIYTIGIGRPNTMQGNGYDGALLSELASISRGKAFSAADKDALSAVYQQIDQLETVEINTESYQEYVDLFPRLLRWVLFLLLADVAISVFLVRRSP